MLSSQEIDQLREALGLLPTEIEGHPFKDIVRRKTLDRRRVSILKSETPLENQSESYDLWKLCRFRQINGDLVVIGWALRSKVTGDYFVFSENW
jgi:hypothetical protein